MPQMIQDWNRLLEKANSLPLSPGVYLMKDRNQKIIYVGKSKKLKNRVSQYFQNSKKNTKTARMVTLTEDFDYILCKTEIEALSLENTLIKQYTPRYNIKLKDAKSYPYIKITADEYPRLICTRTRGPDKAKYFGPFSGTSVAYSILDILHKSLGIPSCRRKFPDEIGKKRPCLYYDIKQCCGLCTGSVSKEEYDGLIRCASDILRGNIGQAAKKLEAEMLQAAEDERFEAAASYRDTIAALKRLQQKQDVVADPETDADVFGLFDNEYGSCLSVLYIRSGIVSDKQDYCFSVDTVLDEDTFSTFLVEHYMKREVIPPLIVTSIRSDEDTFSILQEFLSKKAARKVQIHTPERGHLKQLTQMAVNNAEEQLRQQSLRINKTDELLLRLAQCLQLETIPERIEAYDISNIGAEHTTAGMVVYADGKPQKSDYRIFRIKSFTGQDDYSAMREALARRLAHLQTDQRGSFSTYPDLLLIDGGKGHVATVKALLRELELEIPVFGMVKDTFHKTRALCTESEEINIAKQKDIFNFIYQIQEEVHRYTVSKTMAAKRKTFKHSSLEKIHGIGQEKAKKLLRAFGTLQSLKHASLQELSSVSGISKRDAESVYQYFRLSNNEEQI